MVGRPKVGDGVLVRKLHRNPHGGREEFWDPGKVEIVRKWEVVVRSRYGYELTVPYSDLYELPRHWGKR